MNLQNIKNNTIFASSVDLSTVLGIALIVIVAVSVVQLVRTVRRKARKAAGGYVAAGVFSGAGITNFQGLPEQTLRFLTD